MEWRQGLMTIDCGREREYKERNEMKGALKRLDSCGKKRTNASLLVDHDQQQPMILLVLTPMVSAKQQSSAGDFGEAYHDINMLNDICSVEQTCDDTM